MLMAVQDDARENIMVKLFNLKQAPERARHDPDAYLNHEGHNFQFELKSTTKKSISTVRDFGPDHIKKWLEMHWIVGFFKTSDKDPDYCYYLAPNDMKVWTDQIWESVKVDFQLADCAARQLKLSELFDLVGSKNIYSLADAKSIQKSQYSSFEYKERMDVHELGFSRCRFLSLVAPYISETWLNAELQEKEIYTASDFRILTEHQAQDDFVSRAISPSTIVDHSNAAKVFPPHILEVCLEKVGSGISIKKACALLKWPLTRAGARHCIDIFPGYSPDAMLEILRDRCRYLIRRGSTLNNPHIPESFCAKFDKIKDEHAIELRRKLTNYLISNPPSDLMGEVQSD
jgi:hypothetical protein